MAATESLLHAYFASISYYLLSQALACASPFCVSMGHRDGIPGMQWT